MFKSKLIINVLVVLFTISLTSCKKDDDATPPVVNVVSIKLDKSGVDFEKVKQGDSKQVVVKVTNNSKATIKSLLSKATISGGSVGVSFKFSSLAPGKSIDVPVKFTSKKTTKPGAYKGKLVLTPLNGKSVEVNLSVNVIKADEEPVKGTVIVDKNSIDFGSLPRGTGTGSMKEVIVKLTNNTNKTLEGLTQKLSTKGVGSVEATLVNFSSLAPGKSINIPVKFTSGDTDPGSFKGTLTLIPSIGNPIEIKLSAAVTASGTGTGPTTGKVIVDKQSVDFGSFSKSGLTKTVTIRLTNNTNKTINSIKLDFSTASNNGSSSSSSTLSGSGASTNSRVSTNNGFIKIGSNFSPIEPGKSLLITLEFTSGKSGKFDGKLTLTPSVGEPIDVALSSLVM